MNHVVELQEVSNLFSWMHSHVVFLDYDTITICNKLTWILIKLIFESITRNWLHRDRLKKKFKIAYQRAYIDIVIDSMRFKCSHSTHSMDAMRIVDQYNNNNKYM